MPALKPDPAPASPPKDDPSPAADTHISAAHGIAYWESIAPTVDGMLVGYPYISKADLRGSYLFFQKLRKLYPCTPPHPVDSTTTTRITAAVRPDTEDSVEAGHQTPDGAIGKEDKEDEGNGGMLERGLDVGAGIGRVTAGLLSRLCHTVDIVEQIPTFASHVKTQDMAGPGKVGEVAVCGLQTWMPQEGRVYDVVWAQWFLGHLRDAEVVEFLLKVKGRWEGDGGEGKRKGCLRRGGWIVVKENMSTTMGKNGEVVDVYDELDSCVTRCDATFRRCFMEAGLRVVRSELQKGFERGLLPVRFYALRADEG